MANLIQATPDELRQNGSSFINYSGETNTIVQATQNLTNQMAEMWKGAASEAFVQQYNDLKPTMDKFVQLLADIGTQVQSVAQALEDADNEIAGQIGVN